jgi:hypothetical protein
MRTLAGARRWLLLGATVAACGPLARVRVESWTAPNADLARFRTYDWTSPMIASTRGARDPVAAIDQRVRAAVDAELAAKDCARRASADPADFLVDYDVAIEEKDAESFSELLRYRAAGGTKEAGQSYVEGYDEGTLVLEIMDARTRQVAWRATARAILNDDDPHQRIEEAVHAMLARFPR